MENSNTKRDPNATIESSQQEFQTALDQHRSMYHKIHKPETKKAALSCTCSNCGLEIEITGERNSCRCGVTVNVLGEII